MRWFVSLRAEIARGCDDAAAEVMLPEPIDRHAGRQRMVVIGDPLGQAGRESVADDDLVEGRRPRDAAEGEAAAGADRCAHAMGEAGRAV